MFFILSFCFLLYCFICSVVICCIKKLNAEDLKSILKFSRQNIPMTHFGTVISSYPDLSASNQLASFYLRTAKQAKHRSLVIWYGNLRRLFFFKRTLKIVTLTFTTLSICKKFFFSRKGKHIRKLRLTRDTASYSVSLRLI